MYIVAYLCFLGKIINDTYFDINSFLDKYLEEKRNIIMKNNEYINIDQLIKKIDDKIDELERQEDNYS